MHKSDIFLTISDPRASVVRKHVGFSIKSEFGHNPTLFNTAKSSAVVYEVLGMNESLMNQINTMVDMKGHSAVSERCDALIKSGCKLKFVGFPFAKKANCVAFQENLDLINPRLAEVVERMLWNHFFEHETCVDLEKRKLNKVKGAKCFVINIVKRTDAKPVESVDETIIQIPYLIDGDKGTINYEAIDFISDRC